MKMVTLASGTARVLNVSIAAGEDSHLINEDVWEWRNGDWLDARLVYEDGSLFVVRSNYKDPQCRFESCLPQQREDFLLQPRSQE